MSRLKKTDRARLTSLAEEMLAEARTGQSDRILCSNGFARSNISILHQQMRCANLVWALKFTNKLKPGDVVGVIGGSFSGLMLATALAMCNDVTVYIFEKERRLMQRFLDKSHRFIAPNLNSRSLQYAFHPTLGEPFYKPPIFDWEEGSTSGVASDWVNEFRRYAEKLPIFCFLGIEVEARHVRFRRNSLLIEFDELADGLRSASIPVNWLIDATGFGPEINPHGLTDFSYWNSGHRLIYDHLPPRSRVLVSGCGDSGLVELMHYALKDFSHDHIEVFWPPAPSLDITIDQNLERASFDDITSYPDGDPDNRSLIAELNWFFGICRNGAEGYFLGPSHLDKRRSAVFNALERAFLKAARQRFKELRKGRWQAYLEILPEMSVEEQTAIRSAASPLIDELSSVAIKEAMAGIDLSKILRMKNLHGQARPNIEIVLNGVTPTPFTRQLSPFNVWLMHMMQSFPNVTYRQGNLETVVPLQDGKYKVRFADGGEDTFDRVVTRYGPSGGTQGPLFSRHAQGEPMGWLLCSPVYVRQRGEMRRWIDLAKDVIAAGRVRLVTRRTSRVPDHHVDKDSFLFAVKAPPSSSGSWAPHTARLSADSCK